MDQGQPHCAYCCEELLAIGTTSRLPVPLILEDVSPKVVADLQAPHFTDTTSVLWDNDGSFATPAGQIMIRLSDHGFVGADLNALIAAVSISSPWNIPLIRVATNHTFVANSEKGG